MPDPKSSFQTGEVAVVNVLRIVSSEPVGAEPAMTECRPGSRVEASIS